MNFIKTVILSILFFSLNFSSTQAMEFKSNFFILDIDQSTIQSIEMFSSRTVSFDLSDNKHIWVNVLELNPPDTTLPLLYHFPKDISSNTSNIPTKWLDNINPSSGTLIFKERLIKKQGIIYGISYDKTNEVVGSYIRGGKAYIILVHGHENVFTLKRLVLDTMDNLYPR